METGTSDSSGRSGDAGFEKSVKLCVLGNGMVVTLLGVGTETGFQEVIRSVQKIYVGLEYPVRVSEIKFETD